MSEKRIFISTGEVSGDLQGALLIQALKRQSQEKGIDLEILALGGDRMARAGATLLAHTSEIGSMGILESLPFVLPTLQVQNRAKVYLKQHPPDVVVLIDYMGPNLALCEYFYKQSLPMPVVYYITPQEWVWGDQWKWGVKLFRSDLIVKATKRVLAIFPAEADYMRRKGAQVSWIGHPLVDRLQAAPTRTSARAALNLLPDQPVVTLLPASRQQEIKYLLPVICQAAQLIQQQLPDVLFLIPLALEKYRQPIQQAIQHYGLQAKMLSDQSGTHTEDPGKSVTLQAIAAADLAITKSGTVNLEIALLNTPQVVLYKVNTVTAWILKHILKFSIPFMSPPNLVVMKAIVPEFMQNQATPGNIAHEALEILLKTDRRQAFFANYAEMRQALGEPGVCDRAAAEILQLL
ncbi:lipid-A-disaccharide synthase [Leptolyngbyaceae cyanobacterium JSC-12]|nr:lipid-A-disaccharide synthase [Leptolyngbyaceae cyanobacterium JSC-12]